ncbi:hypothetical protein ILYODFUR_008216 [Ilyodon furcidens]|uniref:Alsin n=2 Tax=Goodeidae TaxID=28758 RepID=A0ABV0TIA7_9TELE
MMEPQRKSSGDDDGGERGLLHCWRGYSYSMVPERLLLPRPVLQVALGAQHGVLLVEGGQVYSFGELPWKQTQVLQTKPTLENALSGQRVVAVAAGSFHSGAVTEDGSVHMWGDNGAGQCGLSGLSCVPNPTPVALPDTGGAQTVPVLELACGEKHSLALSVQREVWAWGSGCQLGLNATVFPVWKPQKVEQLAGRYVLQVACGASHSLALVRCLGPEGVQRPPVDKCNQCNQLLYTMTDKEDHVIISDSHYCPMGVEAKEETPPTQTLKTSPSEPILPSHSSSTSTPAAPTSDPTLDPVSGPQDSQKARLTNGVHPPPDSDTPVPPKAAASSVVKSSPYPDEQEVKEYLRKLSDTSQAEAKMAAGGLHALQPSSSGRGSSALNSLVSSCASAVGERVASTYEALSLKRMMNFYLPSRLEVLGGAADNTAERVRREESVQAKKSSSTGDIHEEEAEGLRRRLSLPGLLSQVSPRLLRKMGRSKTRAFALTPMGGVVPEDQEVFPTLQTEVWSWGHGEHGELGHGDNLARLQPLCIKSLNKKEVIRVAAGAHHSIAVTAQSQVYSWGSNLSGQLGHMETPSSVPRLAKLSEGIRVWDASAGERHTLLLADGDCIQPIIYYSGQQVKEGEEGGVMEEEKEEEEDEEERAGGYTQQAVLLPFCMNILIQHTCPHLAFKDTKIGWGRGRFFRFRFPALPLLGISKQSLPQEDPDAVMVDSPRHSDGSVATRDYQLPTTRESCSPSYANDTRALIGPSHCSTPVSGPLDHSSPKAPWDRIYQGQAVAQTQHQSQEDTLTAAPSIPGLTPTPSRESMCSIRRASSVHDIEGFGSKFKTTFRDRHASEDNGRNIKGNQQQLAATWTYASFGTPVG